MTNSNYELKIPVAFKFPKPSNSGNSSNSVNSIYNPYKMTPTVWNFYKSVYMFITKPSSYTYDTAYRATQAVKDNVFSLRFIENVRRGGEWNAKKTTENKTVQLCLNRAYGYNIKYYTVNGITKVQRSIDFVVFMIVVRHAEMFMNNNSA